MSNEVFLLTIERSVSAEAKRKMVWFKYQIEALDELVAKRRRLYRMLGVRMN